jgi:hypothetical protein
MANPSIEGKCVGKAKSLTAASRAAPAQVDLLDVTSAALVVLFGCSARAAAYSVTPEQSFQPDRVGIR